MLLFTQAVLTPSISTSSYHIALLEITITTITRGSILLIQLVLS